VRAENVALSRTNVDRELRSRARAKNVALSGTNVDREPLTNRESAAALGTYPSPASAAQRTTTFLSTPVKLSFGTKPTSGVDNVPLTRRARSRGT
jgi:hypothetical protein